MKHSGFAVVTESGFVVMGSIRRTKKAARAFAVETEREYMLEDEDYTDEQIWRRLYREGDRIIQVEVSAIIPQDGK